MHCVYGGLPHLDGYAKSETWNTVGARKVSCPCDVCRGDIGESTQCWFREFVPKFAKSELQIGQTSASTAADVMARMTSRVLRNIRKGVPLLVKIDNPSDFYNSDVNFCDTAPCVALAVAAGKPFKPEADNHGRLPAIGGKAVSKNDVIVKVVWASFEGIQKGNRRTVAKVVYSSIPPHEEQLLCPFRYQADCKTNECKEYHYDYIYVQSIIRADKSIEFHSELNGTKSLSTTLLTDAEQKYNRYIAQISKL